MNKFVDALLLYQIFVLWACGVASNLDYVMICRYNLPRTSEKQTR
jgi:hypothetical protein